jgi:hypothetical protein
LFVTVGSNKGLEVSTNCPYLQLSGSQVDKKEQMWLKELGMDPGVWLLSSVLNDSFVYLKQK